MNKLIIFGVGKISDVVSYYFENHSEYEIVAYTVDDEYIKSGSYKYMLDYFNLSPDKIVKNVINALK